MSEKASPRAPLGQDTRDVGCKRSRPTSGSSGGPDLRHEPQATKSRKRAPEADLVAIENGKERQRQERLAKSRATAAVSRERRRIAVGKMGAQADALEQDNSYLQSLLDNKNQQKELLAMELEQLLQAQPDPVSFPDTTAGPQSAACCQVPDLAPVAVLPSEHRRQQNREGRQDNSLKAWKPPFHGLAPAADTLDTDPSQGDACLRGQTPRLNHAADAPPPAAMLSGSQPIARQLQPESRGEPAADALSRGSPGTRNSGTPQIPRGCPETGVGARLGIIVGLDGQWIRLKPGYRPLPAQTQQCLGVLGQPGVPCQPASVPSWAPNQPEQPERRHKLPEGAEPLPEASTKAADHQALQWGTPPTKYDSRESDDLCFGGGLESLGIPDQSGLALQQPGMGLDSELPGSTQPVKSDPSEHRSPITVLLSAQGARHNISDGRSEEPNFLNDSPYLN